MSWRTWLTSCLVAALLGVFLGAVYAAASGQFDTRSPSGTSALPAPREQTAAAATASSGSARRSRAVDPTEPVARSKTSKAKPPKVKHDASGSASASTAKGAGKPKKSAARKTG